MRAWLLCAALLLPSAAWAGASLQLDAMSGASADVQAGIFDGSLSGASEAAVFAQASGAGLNAALTPREAPRRQGRDWPPPAPRAGNSSLAYLSMCAGTILGTILVVHSPVLTAAAASVISTACLLGWLVGAAIYVAYKAAYKRRRKK